VGVIKVVKRVITIITFINPMNVIMVDSPMKFQYIPVNNVWITLNNFF